MSANRFRPPGVLAKRLLVFVLGFTLLFVVRFAILRRAADWASRPIHARLGQAVENDTLPILSFIFQPSDCSNSTAVIADLNAHASSGQAIVRGYLTTPTTRDERRLLAETFGIEFALEDTDDAEVRRVLFQLGYRNTPIVITASEAGRIRYVLEPRVFNALAEFLTDPSSATEMTSGE